MKRKLSLLLLAAVMLLSLCLVTSCKPTQDPPAKTVSFINDGVFDYAIVYSDDEAGHYMLATQIFSSVIVDYELDAPERFEYDDNKYTEKEKEIVIGDTDRQISKDLKAAIAKKENGKGGVWWAYGYKDGKLGFLANSFEAAELGWETFFELIMKKNSIECQDNLWVVDGMTEAEYSAYLESIQDEIKAEEEAKLREKIALIREKIAAINTSSLNAMPKFVNSDGEPSYGYPSIKVEDLYSHPRVWVNEQTLPTVIANLSSEENVYSYELLKKYADLEYTGRLDPLEKGKDANFRVTDAAKIEALAFVYLTTGDELYGYSAIRAAKNFLDTCQVDPDKGTWDDRDMLFDISNWSSVAMGVMAEVYDWCYPLLSKQDKDYIVQAVTTKLTCNLEVANPPQNTGCVTGHSTHILTLRDWPSFAIAVADEYPEIYNYIIGLVEHYYVPPANWAFPSGAHFQGTTYGVNKTYLHNLCALVIGTASGKQVYTEDVRFDNIALSYVHYIRPDDEMMRIGDVNFNGKNYGGKPFTARVCFYAYAMHGGDTLKAWVKYITNDYQSVKYDGNLEFSPTKILLMNDPSDKVEHSDRFNLELINYNGSPFGAITARDAWNDPDGWFTFTKIAEAYQANHDHKEAGTFQIYYKGILAPNSVTYNYDNYTGTTYGDPFDTSYAKQTISKNGLLIYNPKYEKLDGSWAYTGGQSTQGTTSENATLQVWLEKITSHQAKELAHAWGYDQDGSLKYAYIAGDITNAYDQDTVDLVMRSTMSIATGNEAHPLMFIVYDRIASDDASFKKTFLLHTTGEPTFIGESEVWTDSYGIPTHTGVNAFYYTNSLGAAGSYTQDFPDDKYNGKLTNTTLLPEDSVFTVIGGDGKRFWYNGSNHINEMPGEENPQGEVGWGRVEISPVEENLVDSFLNVMYVGDADKNDPYVPAALVKGDTHEGAISFGNCVMFSKSNQPVAEQFSFTSTSDSYLTYYVSGLSEGKWEISVNGSPVTSVKVDSESGLATFKAEAGEITFTPKFRQLSFALEGGDFAEGVKIPSIYNIGEELVLPTDLVLDYYEFDGWYDNENYEGQPIIKLDGEDIGNVNLTAKWRQVADKINYVTYRGVSASELPSRYNYGTAVAIPTDMTRYGSNFAGWYDNPSFSGSPVTEIKADKTGEVTLYAKWDKLFDTLVYELNGGTMEGDSIIKLPLEKHTLPTVVEKENHVFAGWFTDPECTTKVYDVTGVAGSDIIVYAKYYAYKELPATYKNTFNQIIGKEGVQYGDLIANDPDQAVTLEFIANKDDLNSARAGYIRVRTRFLKNEARPIQLRDNEILDHNGRVISNYANGDVIHVVMDFDDNEMRYYINGKYAACVTDLNFNKDLSLYNFVGTNGQQEIGYLWQYNSQRSDSDFTVATLVGDIYRDDRAFDELSLELNGGSILGGAPIRYGTMGYTLPIPTLDGFDFGGWCENEDLSDEGIFEIPAGTSGPKTYYAKWQKVSDKVFFELDGGISAESLPKVYLYETGLVLPTDVSKAYHKFLGWYTSSNFSGDPITEISKDHRGDVTLYAKWEKVQGTVKYDLLGGQLTEGVTLPAVYDYGTAVALPTELTRIGASFAGWYLSSDYSGEAITEISAAQRGDITVYAKWNKTKDVLIYELNGGTMAGESVVDLPLAEFELPTDVTKEGYAFVGWYLESDFKTKVTKITGEAGEDLVVYARFAQHIEAPAIHSNTNNQRYGAYKIKYGDILAQEPTKSVTFSFVADSTDLTSSRNGYFRARTKYLKNEIKILVLLNNEIKTSSGKVISNYEKGDKVDVVMDFDAKQMRYYVNGELVHTQENVNFESDLTHYNYDIRDESKSIYDYFWQYHAGSQDSDFTVAVLLGDIYA